jgi:hypothetical protein
MLVIHGNESYGEDYQKRLANTFDFLKTNVGPQLQRTHSFIKGDGWQMILLAASGFCGTQIWALSIYDEEKETLFRLTLPECLEEPGYDKVRLKQLMIQNIDRFIKTQPEI